MGRRDSLALVGSPPRDGVSIKTPVVVPPYHHYPRFECNEMSRNKRIQKKNGWYLE